MTIKEFWNSQELVVIHCNTKEKAKRLLKVFIAMGKTWQRDNISYTQSGWGFYKEQTCYDNNGSFGQVAVYKIAKAKIIEFDDLEDFKPFNLKSNENIPTSLNSRCWRTYNLIKRNSIENKWTSKQEIIDNDKFDAENNPFGYVKNDRQHDICAGLWEDIDKINACAEIDKIIISNGKGFKLASNIDEANHYIETFKNKAINALVRYSNLKRKMKRDGQGKLLSNRCEPIDEESRAREFVETYIK